MNIYYGSGFSNGEAGVEARRIKTPYLPGHAQVDLSLGKEFGERYSFSVNALNIANRHLLIDNSLTFGGFHYNNPREIYAEFRWQFPLLTFGSPILGVRSAIQKECNK